MYDYDWLVIGSGPAGEKGAVQAAWFGRRVAVVERAPAHGGACVHTGTLPSKTLRETALYLSGHRQREMYGLDVHLQRDVSVSDLMCRQAAVLGNEAARIARNFERHGVTQLRGHADFVDAHTVRITPPEGGGAPYTVTADAILIATGTRPFRPDWVPFGDPGIDCSDTILNLDRIPRAMVVLGGGVIGCEYASIFAALGTRVTLVEGREQILGFLDPEINARLSTALEALGCEILLKREVVRVGRDGDGTLVCTLADGRALPCERLLFAGGRSGNVEGLALENAGITPGPRGLLSVDANYRVQSAHGGRIYAAGDVIGFPALASVAMEQGRVAACHAFELGYKSAVSPLFPYGLYTIPEVATIGETEAQATARGEVVETGRASYGDNARGQIVGDLQGLLKLVFRVADKRLLGVHIIGERATELVHVGQTVMALDGTIDTLVHQVFNFPSLGELYKYAAYDGLGRLARRGAK
jgi:NAD(P) transhydrogenase